MKDASILTWVFVEFLLLWGRKTHIHAHVKNLIFASFLLASFSSFAQPVIYQAVDVDTAATPRGGISVLNAFIQTNLRKPIPAEAAGVGGMVLVTGIVEPDGSVSGISVTRSLRPDCDREALRVFNLFRAWRPAKKDGKVVRQQVNMPIVYKANKPYIYENGAQISYFDKDNNPVAPEGAVYKQITPLDSAGIPTGDVVLYKRKGDAWKEETRMPLVIKENAYKTADGRSVRLIGYPNSVIRKEGRLVAVDDKGIRVEELYYQNGKRVGTEYNYYPNGLVEEEVAQADEKTITTTWFANGQIKEISLQTPLKQPGKMYAHQIMNAWDSTGHILVKGGNGLLSNQTRVKSYGTDTTQYTIFTEQGEYLNGFKQGKWVGKYADGSYFYEEEYDKDELVNGKAKRVNADTIRYTILEQQPEFQGGYEGLGRFLGTNLSYPADAQRANVQGQVFVSFVVCTDGSLCDYEVIKGVHPSVDQEALRVVKKMSGLWKPGLQRGEKVRVKYNLPINFTLY